ncbi:hypothetical protein JW949_04470 [Candidatus Woesearchaeota archaeon]|nr:hypothetical protein [Candidatus Woesearchaeota archaeon]
MIRISLEYSICYGRPSYNIEIKLVKDDLEVLLKKFMLCSIKKEDIEKAISFAENLSKKPNIITQLNYIFPFYDGELNTEKYTLFLDGKNSSWESNIISLNRLYKFKKGEIKTNNGNHVNLDDVLLIFYNKEKIISKFKIAPLDYMACLENHSTTNNSAEFYEYGAAPGLAEGSAGI